MQISEHEIIQFEQFLREEEKSEITIKKYVRDAEKFREFAGGREISKNLVVDYKAYLTEKYKPASVNSMLAAVNCFLEFLNVGEFKAKPLKLQKRMFLSVEKELKFTEYKRLISRAEVENKQRLKLILETITSTGIRISELKFITVGAVRKGYTEVDCKGKYRLVFLPKSLCEVLKKYIAEQKIKRGSVFVTRNGNPVDHGNLLREMKKLADAANVDKRKVYPHNFRHFFARTFYSKTKDLSRLADILGHSNVNTTKIYTAESGSTHLRLLNSLGLVLTR